MATGLMISGAPADVGDVAPAPWKVAANSPDPELLLIT